MAVSKRNLVLALVALALALSWGRWPLPAWLGGSGDDTPRLCFDQEHGRRPECFFSQNYFEARERFRNAARDARAELHSLPIVQGLTTDIALFRATGTGPHALQRKLAVIPGHEDENGDAEPDTIVHKPAAHSLLLHLSGTHGVEGYVGSGVQLAVLKDPEILRRISALQNTGVSVAIVHAVNPYGMAYWRRFNEANIDLNRNAMFSEEQWQEVLARPANLAGYMDINHLLNPGGQPYPGQRLLLLGQSLWQILTKGFVKVKAALVTGTYGCPTCVYYGGRSLQPSHQALSEWIRRQFVDVPELPVSRLALVDVHSGLGPLGRDTLMDSHSSTENVTELFHTPGDPAIELGVMAYEVSGLTDGQSAGAASGYDLVVGDVADNYPKLFGDRLRRGVVSITQEFGTVPGILVALAVIEENQIWQQEIRGAEISRDAAATNVREVFYPTSQRFRESVFLRGRSVFRQVLNWVGQQ